MKILKFEACSDLIKDLRAVHNMDIINNIKSKLLELETTWEQFPNNQTKHNKKLKFHLQPRWIDNEDGSESFAFNITKEVLPL